MFNHRSDDCLAITNWNNYIENLDTFVEKMKRNLQLTDEMNAKCTFISAVFIICLIVTILITIHITIVRGYNGKMLKGKLTVIKNVLSSVK